MIDGLAVVKSYVVMKASYNNNNNNKCNFNTAIKQKLIPSSVIKTRRTSKTYGETKIIENHTAQNCSLPYYLNCRKRLRQKINLDTVLEFHFLTG